MKKIGFIFIFLIILTISAFGQQFLWSTEQKDGVRYVAPNDVIKEVLVFYDQYRYYYDLAGFNKDRFIEMIDYGFEDWEWIREINKLTVFALRSNSGRGSVVFVMCISKDNVNALLFINKTEFGFNCQETRKWDRDKFTKWFGTLLN